MSRGRAAAAGLLLPFLAGCPAGSAVPAGGPEPPHEDPVPAQHAAPVQHPAPAQHAAPDAALASDRWRPQPGLSWHWQLSGPLDLDVDADVVDLDGDTTPATTVAALHERGRRVICYVSVGTFEPYRPDAGAFPPEVLGLPLQDWPDERWLDVRRLDVLGPLLGARLDECAAKGFDAVEPDNVDGYANLSGFPLTPADQLAFNRWVAAAAHQRGLSVGLKNDLDQVAELVEDFDFAVVEECLAYDECDSLAPFLAAGKAVLHAEYDVPAAGLCDAPAGFSSIVKKPELDAWVRTCPG